MKDPKSSSKSDQPEAAALERTGSQTSPQSAELRGGGGGRDLSQVREILFGAEMAQYEAALRDLEDRMARETSALRTDLRQQIAAFERLMQNETKVVVERLNTEQRERESGLEELGAKLRAVGENQGRQLVESDARHEKERGSLREELVAQIKRVEVSLEQRHQEAVALMSDGMRELRSAKTDRGTLSSLLQDLATRLQDEPGADAAEG